MTRPVSDSPPPAYHRLDADAVVEAVAGGELPEEYADRVGLPRGDVLRAIRRRVAPGDRAALLRSCEEARARANPTGPGDAHPTSRYTHEELESARARLVSGASYLDVARGFGVSRSRAREVMLRTYPHLAAEREAALAAAASAEGSR